MHKLILKSLVLALTVLCLLAAAGQAQQTPSLYLRVSEINFTTVQETTTVESLETLIFTDGLVISTRGLEDASCHILRSTRNLGNLQRVLTQNQIGRQAGNCFLSESVGFPIVSRSRLITWFGKGGRQHTLEASDRFQEPCTSVQAIVDALDSYIRGAWGDPKASVATTTCQQPALIPN